MFSALADLQRFDELSGRTLFLCVGGMRCATSWLTHYLEGLPDVAVSPIKEVHFFNAKFQAHALSDMDELAVRRLARLVGRGETPGPELIANPFFRASMDRVQMIYDDNAYFAHFARICTPDTRTFCDITPAYSVIGPTGFEYLREFCASQEIRVKLALILRDPIDRLWSQLRYMQQVNPKGAFTEDWETALLSPRLCARADYQGTVEDLDAHFPADDILYLFYEDLFDPDTIAGLCQFIGVEYRPADLQRRENEGTLEAALTADARDAFHRFLAPQYAFCRDRFGDLIPDAWSA